MPHLAACPRGHRLGVHLCGALAAVVSAAAVLGLPVALGPSEGADRPVVGEARHGVEGSAAALRPEAAEDLGQPPPDPAQHGDLADPPPLPLPDIDEQFVDPGYGEPAPRPAAGDDRSGGPEGASHDDPARERRAAQLAERFPGHAQARQGDEPASQRWALVVGVNAYQGGGVRDTFGSVPDAEELAAALEERGWRDEHVLMLTDADATGEMVRAGIEWLAERTDDSSTVVASFSGHLQHRDGTTALWPTDHDYLWADEVGDRFADVAADRMWLSFQGCHAQGLRSPELHRDGRVITYSSATAEKSHEDPGTGHSVQGHYLFAEGVGEGRAQPDGDRTSVQQAFRWAAPRILERTAGQQTPQIWDGLDEPFRLAPPEA